MQGTFLFFSPLAHKLIYFLFIHFQYFARLSRCSFCFCCNFSKSKLFCFFIYFHSFFYFFFLFQTYLLHTNFYFLFLYIFFTFFFPAWNSARLARSTAYHWITSKLLKSNALSARGERKVSAITESAKPSANSLFQPVGKWSCKAFRAKNFPEFSRKKKEIFLVEN